MASCCVAPLSAAPPPSSSSLLEEPAFEQGALQSLEALQRALALKESEAASLQAELAAASDDMQRDDIRRRLLDVRADIEEHRRRFDGFATDVDLAPFSPEAESKFDWQE